MALAFWAARRRGEEESGWLGRAGVRWALAATAVQMAGGFWFLFSLPTDIQKALVLGQGTPTVLLAVAMCLGFLTLMLLARLEDPVAQRALLHGAAASLVLTILGMVMLRDAVRDLYLQSVLQPETLPVRAEPDLMLLFAVVLLLGLATLAWLGRRIARDRSTPSL
jgi:hypothetical protein